MFALCIYKTLQIFSLRVIPSSPHIVLLRCPNTYSQGKGDVSAHPLFVVGKIHRNISAYIIDSGGGIESLLQFSLLSARRALRHLRTERTTSPGRDGRCCCHSPGGDSSHVTSSSTLLTSPLPRGPGAPGSLDSSVTGQTTHLHEKEHDCTARTDLISPFPLTKQNELYTRVRATYIFSSFPPQVHSHSPITGRPQF